MLQLEIKDKTHVLEFRSLNHKDPPRASIYISKLAANNIRAMLADKDTRFIDLKDDAGEFIESISKNEIRGIKKIGAGNPRVDESKHDRFMVCEYGGRHKHLGREGFEECKCAKRFNNVNWMTFQKLATKLFPEVKYESDITPVMQVRLEKECAKLGAHVSSVTLGIAPKRKDDFESIGDVATRVLKNSIDNSILN